MSTESVVQDWSASGAEIAPLVDGAAEPEEHPEKRAEREVAEAEELLRQWEASRRDDEPFDLTVKSMIGGEGAAVTLKGVRSEMSVAELHKRMRAPPALPSREQAQLHSHVTAEQSTVIKKAFSQAFGVGHQVVRRDRHGVRRLCAPA